MKLHRMSLGGRLALTFCLITAACFGVVGTILYRTLCQQVHEQNDIHIVMTARHMRRLVGEFDSLADLASHRDRLITIALGDPAMGMKILDARGQVLIDYDPGNVPLVQLTPVAATERVQPENLERWTDPDNIPIQGVAVNAAIANHEVVTIEVARAMVDRAALLARYRTSILITVALGTLAAMILNYLLIGRALRPLATIANSARDITAQRLDRRIDERDAPAELQDVTAALNAMLQRLQQGFDRLSQFTADLAHDIRTPIGNLRGASEVALSRPRSAAEYEAVLASNVEECDRVARMIDKVLFLARAENPQFAIKRCVFDAREELLMVVDYFEGMSAESGVEVRVEGNAQVKADRELFRRAVSNLLANALRYTPRGGVIELGIEQRDADVRISVTNPGEGISAEDADKVFDRFYRADKARSKSSQSTGLGLAIVRTILELHGGEASLRREVPGKTRFELRFPLVAPVRASATS